MGGSEVDVAVAIVVTIQCTVVLLFWEVFGVTGHGWWLLILDLGGGGGGGDRGKFRSHFRLRLASGGHSGGLRMIWER